MSGLEPPFACATRASFWPFASASWRKWCCDASPFQDHETESSKLSNLHSETLQCFCSRHFQPLLGYFVGPVEAIGTTRAGRRSGGIRKTRVNMIPSYYVSCWQKFDCNDWTHELFCLISTRFVDSRTFAGTLYLNRCAIGVLRFCWVHQHYARNTQLPEAGGAFVPYSH